MFISPLEFKIENGNLVKENSRGFSFVFFFTQECIFCNDVKPAFDKLATTIKGISFEMCNVFESNNRLIHMTQNTNHPITYVPFLILFANGNIIGQYLPNEENPQNNLHEMFEFLTSQTTKYVQQYNSQEQQLPQRETTTTFGIPYNRASRKVCKLYSDAY
jgi:thiol-disulfide isomerase/thioredoxin